MHGGSGPALDGPVLRVDDAGGFSVVVPPAAAALQGASILSSSESSRFSTWTPMFASGRTAKKPAAGGESYGPSGFVKLVVVPVFVYYVGIVVAMFIPAEVVDSGGVSHSVRLGMTPSFTGCWYCFLNIDMWILCPIHYWLTLYDAVRTPEDGHQPEVDPRVSGWSSSHRQLQANARDRVDAAAVAVATLTRWEATHFSMTVVPQMGVMIWNGFLSQGSTAVTLPAFLLMVLAMVFGGQLKYRVFTQPRVAILRFRGPATADFVWWAVQLELKVLVLAVLWCVYITAYWSVQPIFVPMDPPTQEQFPHPSAFDPFFSDPWTGVNCKGHVTGDLEDPWVASVQNCSSTLFFNTVSDAQADRATRNATFDSIWRASPMGHWIMPQNVVSFSSSLIVFYTMFVGQGMFSDVQQLHLNRAEACAVACLCSQACFFLADLLIFWRPPSPDYGLLFTICSTNSLPVIGFTYLGQLVVLYRDSLAELAESRSKNRARWTLQREFAAFMSHYKNGAPLTLLYPTVDPAVLLSCSGTL
jgi:hypothetical protein